MNSRVNGNCGCCAMAPRNGPNTGVTPAAPTCHCCPRARRKPGDGALFAHVHLLRTLTGTWLGLGAAGGRLFKLGTASVSILGWERGQQAISR